MAESDPNELYQQSQKNFLSGVKFCAKHEAVRLAALQLQVMIGDYDEVVHKYANITAYLARVFPMEWAKERSIEPHIAEEWQDYQGMKQMAAKLRYIQFYCATDTCVTFFHVMEEKKGDRTIPRLFGVKRDEIIVVDDITMDVVDTWPLIDRRLWTVCPGIVRFKFCRTDQIFYMTSEAQKIYDLISGNFNIIKKKEAVKKFILPGKAEMEDNIAPRLATQMQLVEQASPPFTGYDMPPLATAGDLRNKEGQIAQATSEPIKPKVGGLQAKRHIS